ncbi:hypothetical protein O3Q52_11660 [Streptomyces sp. ActVer]|uniref:hypothetical protein n=1 Tax=Streptomyces sp. ActVer TaxID=3014558 RepID=UPI0022B3AD8E|nr:hypothetical protein [Streptomyces sp. ActVer]MCZ4508848.1 hypothetical protein [Streptomyces sp. ActVer]
MTSSDGDMFDCSVEFPPGWVDVTDESPRTDDDPIIEARYYSETGRRLANLEIDSYGEEGVLRPSPDAVLPLVLDWSNADITGEPEVTHPELPAGPAMRVQATMRVKRMFGLRRKRAAFVKYVVYPPDMENLVVVTVEWEAIARTEEIVRLVEEVVQAMSLTPLAADAEGSE